MTKLRKTAKKLVEIINEDRERFEESNELQDRIFEDVDSKCIDTNLCWDIAKEASISDLDSGLWEGTEDIDMLISRIAFAAIEQEIYDIIYSNYPELEKILKQ